MLLHICPWLQMSQHSGNIHLLTGFPIAEVNSQINPNNRSPPSLAIFDERIKHKMWGSQQGLTNENYGYIT